MCNEFKVKVAKLLFFYNVCAKYFYELLFFFYVYLHKNLLLMNWIDIVTIIVPVVILVSVIFFLRKERKVQDNMSNTTGDYRRYDMMSLRMRVESRKLILPLKIQAYERLLLYIERIQFSVLVKRIYSPHISRNDFQFSLLQNVQDEYEHNLAQRLYVTEETWQLIGLAKEEVLQNVNAVFNDNPEADVAMIAQKLASFNNPIVEKAVISIKREFDAL